VNLTLRRARIDDVPRLVRLERDCFTGCYQSHAWTRNDFVAYLLTDKTVVRVAVDARGLAGYVAGRVDVCGVHHLARVDSVAVYGRSRRRGVGRRLMVRFEIASALAGCRAVMLGVSETNEGGLRFFRGRGYRRTRRLPGYYDGGVDGVRMRLALR
jgi:ribosomal protein S18 acetylase RimI-like enzyme